MIVPASPVAKSRCRPRGCLDYEPMFDSKQTLTTRLEDAADLVIDFATLGEYGLEPVDRQARPCQARRRAGTRSSGAWSSAIERFAAHS
jgi:hypothetical protein